MTKRMLIDSTHAEETRVVVLDGNRLEDFDVETSTKKQLKGNIYLAKIVRVEPSLQAAFVEYGGNRHGFLAFGEIHPDYYQIPVADRQRLMEMQEAEAREDEEQEDAAARAASGGRRGRESPDTEPLAAPADTAVEATIQAAYATQADPDGAAEAGVPDHPIPVVQAAAMASDLRVAPEEAREEFPDTPPGDAESDGAAMAPGAADGAGDADAAGRGHAANGHDSSAEPHGLDDIPPEPPPEAIGGDQSGDEQRERRAPPRFLRNYKIQEVIHRRQILLIQVVKEERGTKGAALTTYISLAGRFSVLMPNSPRGGGVSRKITSASDRRRLKEVMQELELPRGMGLIIRTAGANRPKPEIMRDGEYLLTQWDQIRDNTMRSTAPALIYEEASLIKRAIRDVYSREFEDVLVDGEAGWRAARDYMRMLMPAHARKVQLWRDAQPLFAKQHVDIQLDAMLSPTVQLRSGGYLVINQTEALVAIDVNSGRSTRERGIEETALRTNMEAAEEVARQLRLRDLAGLIVIDFIDMESRRNNAMVERRLKDSLRNDRARIQVGSISHFGLLEMSRQRLRPSIGETSFVACPHCGGTGHVRSTESAALHVLRGIEEEGAKRRHAEILVHVASGTALYVLNHKRDRLAEIESRFGMRVAFASDDGLIPPQMRVVPVRAHAPGAVPPLSYSPPPISEDDLLAQDEEAEEAEFAEADDAPVEARREPEGAESERDPARRKRRRRRRGAHREDGPAEEEAGQPGPEAAIAEDGPGEIEAAAEAVLPSDLSEAGGDEPVAAAPLPAADGEDDKPRRRGRRGGRRRRKGEGDEPPEPTAEDAGVAAAPAYAGPTPADPFATGGIDVFEVIEAAEERAAMRAPRRIPIEAPELGTVSSVAYDPAIAGPAAPPAERADTPEPASAEAVAPAEPVPQGAPPADAEPNGVAAQDPALEAAPAEEPAQPETAPAVIPIIVGSTEAAEGRKRGWWRR